MAATSPQQFSVTSPSVDCKCPREVADSDNVSRHIFSPRMGEVDRFIWNEVFEFPSVDGRVESVVWREIRVSDESVHVIGYEKEKANRGQGKPCEYIGFITANAGLIRNRMTTRGHYFYVYHVPEQGDWHVHIQIIVAQGIDNLSKGDKSDIRAIMEHLFERFTRYERPT